MPRIKGGLSPRQKVFAKVFVEKGHKTSAMECAIMAGYSKKSAVTQACNLRNKKIFPFVYDFIEKLQKEKKIDDDKKFYQARNTLTNLFIKAEEQLKKNIELGKYNEVSQSIKKFKPILSLMPDHIKVYLAEEQRPYHTNHYKIGMTKHDDIEDRRSFTDNPYGLNYICYIEYYSSNGLNLETSLHRFFKHFSTKKYGKHGSSEWFYVKNRKRMISTFIKVSRRLCEKNDCASLIKFTSQENQ